MDLSEGLEKLKGDIEGEVKKVAESADVEEAVKKLIKEGTKSDDIMADIKEKFPDFDAAKLKELVDKVLKKDEPKEVKKEEKEAVKEDKEEIKEEKREEKEE